MRFFVLILAEVSKKMTGNIGAFFAIKAYISPKESKKQYKLVEKSDNCRIFRVTGK